MASCKTVQWAADAPYVKLTVTKKALTTSEVTLAYRLEYISTTPIAVKGLRNYTISMANTVVANGTFDLYNKTGVNFAGGNTVTLPITTATKSISFKVAFAFELQQPDGSIVDTLEATGSIPVSLSNTYTTCGIPSIVNVTDNNNNVINISCLVGANGLNNSAEGIELFVTCDGSEPSITNYKYRYTLWGNAGERISTAISFADLPESTVARIFGSTCTNPVKIAVRTFGDAESVYNSAIVTSSTPFVWHGQPTPPKVTLPALLGDMIGPYTSYKVTWEPGIDGKNNIITKYALSVYNLTTKRKVATYSTTNLYYDVPSSAFIANNIYRFDVSSVGAYTGFNSIVASSGPLTIKAVAKLPYPDFNITDGTTVPSIELYNERTYVDIDSGNVLNVAWDTPTAANNIVDSYTISLSKYNPDTGAYVLLYKNNIGNVNSFSVNANHLAAAELAQYTLQISLVAHSKYGQVYDSAAGTVNVQICKGSGTYLKVEHGYPQPIMKRALAFAKLEYLPLKDASGKALTDATGKILYAKTARTQATTAGWTLVQEAFAKDSDQMWHDSDVQYEVLVDADGEIISDLYNNDIYTL
jgi:hypothetical protein